jgi:hypothetical protein
VLDIAEREGRGENGDLSAAQILALHAEHRKGLHTRPVPDCMQCTFDGLDHAGRPGVRNEDMPPEPAGT